VESSHLIITSIYIPNGSSSYRSLHGYEITSNTGSVRWDSLLSPPATSVASADLFTSGRTHIKSVVSRYYPFQKPSTVERIRSRSWCFKLYCTDCRIRSSSGDCIWQLRSTIWQSRFIVSLTSLVSRDEVSPTFENPKVHSKCSLPPIILAIPTGKLLFHQANSLLSPSYKSGLTS
jgi:hypothetical protein